MKNPLFYLSAIAVYLFCATPAKAKNLVPNSSEAEREVVNDEGQDNAVAANATLEQINNDSLSLSEKLKRYSISQASRANLRERLIQYRDAAKSEELSIEAKLLRARESLSQRFDSPKPALKEVRGLDFPDDLKSQDSTWRNRLKPAPSTLDITNDLVSKSQQPSTLTPIADSELQKVTKQFSTFPVGLSVGKRTVRSSVIIRGQEDGTQAINFQNWLLPFDDVIQALKLDVKNLPDGLLEVRSPGIVTRIDPKKLRTDPELGLVFSIQDLNTLFGVKAKFSINDYAIELDVPWLNQSTRIGQTDAPIILEGLPRIGAGNFSFGAIEQKLNASGSEGSSANYRGDVLAVGTAFGGSWFVRTDQPNFRDANTWRLAEAQFYRPNDRADYIVGSQPTFWRSQSASDYWGFTYIQRQGFTPPQLFGGGFVDPRQRLQASQIGRTITGTAQPGTLVRLTEAFGDRVIGEVLVDSSGTYRFENVKSDNQYFGSSYRVLLYPEGRLTAQPEIREATYSVVPGQLPAGSSALVFSGGLRRDFQNQNVLGNFSEFRGGIAQRWGLSENLTVGVGGVYDDSARGLAELFYRPANLPLQVALSTLSGNKWDVNADVRFYPTRSLSASYTRDSFSSRFNVDWRVFPALSLFATTDSRSATGGGIQLNLSGRNAFTFARVSLDTDNNLRWSWLQRLGRLELNQRGNEIGTLSELNYNFSRNSSFLNLGNSLTVGYETRAANGGNNLLSLGWRYRSQARANDGNYRWEAQLGYGIGSQGSGPFASLSTTVLPGILLRARYQAVSVTNDQSSFNIDLVSSLGLQNGITPGDRRSNYLRTQGGLLIQPFYDNNNNGRRDEQEGLYTENPDTLLLINNRLVKSLQPDIQRDRILVRLNPGTYRLDLDPAGFPEDWQAQTDAYAVDVVAGSYTPVLLPLTRAYTFSGVITDAEGQPISGARVEAVSKDSKVRLFSVTNTAGVYYLERLQQGTYDLLINDKPVTGMTLKLDAGSQGFQEMNVQQLENQDFRAVIPSVNQSALPNKKDK